MEFVSTPAPVPKTPAFLTSFRELQKEELEHLSSFISKRVEPESLA
jgi:hypothetical protein